MPSVSTAKHSALVRHLEKLQETPEEHDLLHADVYLLQQIFERYQARLEAARRLAHVYDTIQRRVRVELRKRQVVNAKYKQYASE